MVPPDDLDEVPRWLIAVASARYPGLFAGSTHRARERLAPRTST